LVHLGDSPKKVFDYDINRTYSKDEFPSKILRESKKSKRENGINSLCFCEGVIEWNYLGKEVKTPLILCPIDFRVDTIKNILEFTSNEEDKFINPFVIRYLSSEHGISLNQENLGHLILSEISTLIEDVGLEWNVLNDSYIGNFHHHRYEILKELEALVETDDFSNSLSELMGGSVKASEDVWALHPGKLFPADLDHEQVFDHSILGNLVIQGPPGTGKSQVSTNLIAKLVHAEKNIIVVSEKHVALEVIQQKLASFDLDKLCYIAGSRHENKHLVASLKDSWEFYENQNLNDEQNLMLSEQLKANLQMTLDLLNVPDLIGGVSFSRFNNEKGEDAKWLKASYYSSAPRLKDYFSSKKITTELYSLGLAQMVGTFKSSALRNNEFIQLDEKVNGWIRRLKKLAPQYNFTNWNNFISAMSTAADYQVFQNETYKKYSAIFTPESKEQKKFLRLRKQFKKAQIKTTQFLNGNSHWKIQPSKDEVDTLLSSLQTGGVIERVKGKIRWKKLSTVHVNKAIQTLASKQQRNAEFDALSQIKVAFCDLNITDAETEVDLIYSTLTSYTKEKWQNLLSMDFQQVELYTSTHQELNRLYHELKDCFNFKDDQDFMAYLASFSGRYAQLFSLHDELSVLDDKTLRTLNNNKSFEDYKRQVLFSNWTFFQKQFPNLSEFEPSSLYDRVDEIIKVEGSEANWFASNISSSISRRFSDYHSILNTPARKLSSADKELKKKLKKGKSILVREFAKTRRHLSPRELFNSDAKEWLVLLKPIWLSNPAELSHSFPMEKGLFDVVLFDEASQLPLENALGALQRSKSAVVAGDEHQMGPSSYFKSGSNETIDLLHQANYYYPKVELSHHYRSQNIELIKFSNSHFYSNTLKPFPSSHEAENAVRHRYVQDGKFVDRINQKEADALCGQLRSLMGDENTIGVVAFSEEQLNCIWSCLSGNEQNTLSERIDNGTAFFKALENVQGDECDHLLISFGYGKDQEGNFNMRFGPMNMANGRKRLNVLLTRATKTIDFYCSIRSTEFKISDNESVNLIRRWISFSESERSNSTLEFPYGLKPRIKGGEIYFDSIHEKMSTSTNLVTLQRALSARGWNIHYT
jgi:superfamily I DNA and/or RNA helicase